MHRRESAKGDAKAPRWMSCGWSPTRAERGRERAAPCWRARCRRLSLPSAASAAAF